MGRGARTRPRSHHGGRKPAAPPGDARPSGRWAGPRAGRPPDWRQPARPLTSRRRELHPPPAFSRSPLPPAPAGRRPPRQPVSRSSGPGLATPPAPSGPAPHHFRTFSMAAITFLMSSLARLRVSARTDRPDMAAAGAAGAGALLPRPRESRASRTAACPPQQRHRSRRPLRARVREEARAPARLLGLEASARLRAPPRAALPGRPRSLPSAPVQAAVREERRHVLRARRGARRCPWAPFRGLEVGTFALLPGLLPLATCYAFDPNGCAVLLPLLSSSLAFRIVLLCSNHRISHLNSVYSPNLAHTGSLPGILITLPVN